MIVTEPILYRRYTGMISRCHKEKSSAYKNYGGRGIRVCDEWLRSYEAFESWALSHGFSPELSIDRIDVNKGYSPDNCRWTDAKTQANNKQKNLVYHGVRHSDKEWGEILGISAQTVRERYNKGWPIEKIIHPENFPYERPAADATLMTCPVCGSGSVTQEYTGEDPPFGWGRCRKCKHRWEMSAEDFTKFCIRYFEPFDPQPGKASQ